MLARQGVRRGATPKALTPSVDARDH